MKNYRGVQILKTNTVGHHGRNVKRNAWRVMLVEGNEVLAERFISEPSLRILEEHVTFLQNEYNARAINGVLVITPENLEPLQSKFLPTRRNEMLQLLNDIGYVTSCELDFVKEDK